jgi:hypothetical protein
VTGTVQVRRSVAHGTVSMLLGTAEDNANALFDGDPALVQVQPVGVREEVAS